MSPHIRFIWIFCVLFLLSFPAFAQNDPPADIRLRAMTGVDHNAEWTPYIQDFQGVEMVLVPAGCYDMGNEQGFANEVPVTEQCFDAPFWIDRLEVSNAQFETLNGRAGRESFWTTPAQPRESINWVEANDYCKRRGGRLPTEAEWEYAARGPDNLIYPWGDRFEEERTVYLINSGDQTAPVDGQSDGESWVGARNMNGNVYEWVSTIFVEAFGMWIYPYNPADGRENDMDSGFNRVFRGGAWSSDITTSTRRETQSPSYYTFSIGFRCARDFRPSDLD